MARIAGVNLPNQKRLEIGLTYIYGIGRHLHEEPQVPNFVLPYRGPELREGMTLAIEPMITADGPRVLTRPAQVLVP